VIEGAGGLHEYHRVLWDLRTGLLRVGRVIQADTEYVAGHEGRQQAGNGGRPPAQAEATKQVAPQALRGAVVYKAAIALLTVVIEKANDVHGGRGGP
jgi:hypothetical protein